mmetsp:Transcript_3003/g.6004  ORF Transcript_3003/g.6004 Transcript_3003/m.6004 type:complete len:410 (-) Transcript_3003:250-1479(-)|eukprot:CAMPEP_0171381286 /NCGR_PEP_ID=MMETSP0879-20121228/31409_1 /TAXON_ID=67004 /ORGANISM="Thalassiosira weissflogii, Strain CCMP1336" /LENGTH=409 /DNA_ID=CAMNT_0011892673 /DNA_START=33 /DNA_END=1262 /DNA_ORIENTATION=-
MSTTNSASPALLLAELHSPATPTSLTPTLLTTLLHRVFSHPKIFRGFVDILNFPSVQITLGQMPEKKRRELIRTVELFGFGTIRDYYEIKRREKEGGSTITGDDNNDEFVGVWTLTEVQLEKLRMLSVVTIIRRQIMGTEVTSSRKKAATIKKKRDKTKILTITYQHLADELQLFDKHHDDDNEMKDDGVNTVQDPNKLRIIENLLIQCIYSDLLSAKLDQRSKSLKMDPTSSCLEGGNNESGNNSGVNSMMGQGTKKKREGSDGSGGGICGSLFSRDLPSNGNTAKILADATAAEKTGDEEASLRRMVVQLETFLSKSNTLLATLEKCSSQARKARVSDDLRWREVDRTAEESVKLVKGGLAGGGSMGGGGGMGRIGSGERSGFMSGMGEMMSRQVKRSKGGQHSVRF